MQQSDELFTANSGVVHPVHCLTLGDVTCYAKTARTYFYMENMRTPPAVTAIRNTLKVCAYGLGTRLVD